MGKPKQRVKGDVFRPVATVLKEKDGTPTKISFNGQEYALIHPNYINGHKSKVKKRRVVDLKSTVRERGIWR